MNKSETTFDISLAQARLLAMPARSGVPVRVGPVPVVPTTTGITSHVRRFRSIATRTSILELGASVMGMTMMRTAGDVVILLYDVAEPAIHGWLDDGIANGSVRIAVRSAEHMSIVDAGVCDMARWLGRLAMLSKPCSSSDIALAIDEVMTALHEPEGLQRLSLDDMTLENVTVAIVTPFDQSNAAPEVLN